jgi:hypothetical protein
VLRARGSRVAQAPAAPAARLHENKSLFLYFIYFLTLFIYVHLSLCFFLYVSYSLHVLSCSFTDLSCIFNVCSSF